MKTIRECPLRFFVLGIGYRVVEYFSASVPNVFSNVLCLRDRPIITIIMLCHSRDDFVRVSENNNKILVVLCITSVSTACIITLQHVKKRPAARTRRAPHRRIIRKSGYDNEAPWEYVIKTLLQLITAMIYIF